MRPVFPTKALRKAADIAATMDGENPLKPTNTKTMNGSETKIALPIRLVPCPGCQIERVALVDLNVISPPVSDAQRRLREQAQIPNRCSRCEELAAALAKTNPELAQAFETARRGRPLLFQIHLQNAAACG